VGKVDIRERHSFVDVAAEHANAILAKLNRAEIKGHKSENQGRREPEILKTIVAGWVKKSFRFPIDQTPRVYEEMIEHSYLFLPDAESLKSKRKQPARAGTTKYDAHHKVAGANLRSFRGSTPGTFRFQDNRQRGREEMLRGFRDVPGFPARLAAAGRLFREALAFAQGFSRYKTGGRVC